MGTNTVRLHRVIAAKPEKGGRFTTMLLLAASLASE